MQYLKVLIFAGIFVDSWKFFAYRDCRLRRRRRRRRHYSTSSLHRTTTVVRMGKLRVPRRARLFIYPSPSSRTNSRVRPAMNPGLLARTCPFTMRGVYVCVWVCAHGCISDAFPLLSKPSGVIRVRFRTCWRWVRLVNKGGTR